MSQDKIHMSLVILGQVNSGKSTIAGRLLYEIDAMSDRELAKLAEAAQEIGCELISGYCRKHSNYMNIIDGIISLILKYQKIATWSNIHKGKLLSLEEDDTKAIASTSEWKVGQSVRGDFSVSRNQISSWELECWITGDWCNFFGVVTSEVEDFDFTAKCTLAQILASAFAIVTATTTTIMAAPT